MATIPVGAGWSPAFGRSRKPGIVGPQERGLDRLERAGAAGADESAGACPGLADPAGGVTARPRGARVLAAESRRAGAWSVPVPAYPRCPRPTEASCPEPIPTVPVPVPVVPVPTPVLCALPRVVPNRWYPGPCRSRSSQNLSNT